VRVGQVISPVGTAIRTGRIACPTQTKASYWEEEAREGYLDYALTTLPLRRQSVQTRTRLVLPPDAFARTGRKLMFQRRLVTLCAWLTLFPVRGFLPQTSHTCAMTTSDELKLDDAKH
jgi:hypothetical protein